MEIEMPVLLAYAIEDSTDIFRILGGGGLNIPNPPSQYATEGTLNKLWDWECLDYCRQGSDAK